MHRLGVNNLRSQNGTLTGPFANRKLGGEDITDIPVKMSEFTHCSLLFETDKQKSSFEFDFSLRWSTMSFQKEFSSDPAQSSL